MRFVGLIPARGGSQGIPGKNIAPCAGRPLLAWTCEAALASRRLSRTILSTDAEEIAAVGRRCGVEVPFLRTAALAADETPAVDVMRHALEHVEADAIVLLQPTSPLRAAKHIDEAIGVFEAGKADTVVSVVEVPHRFHPRSVMKEEQDSRLVPYQGSDTVTRRQELAPLWARNGPAVLVVSARLVREGKLYGGRTLGYRMGARESLDIDTPEDLRMAELLLA